jgi:hypothetical protein
VLIGGIYPVIQLKNPCPDRPYQAALTILTPTVTAIARWGKGYVFPIFLITNFELPDEAIY